MYKAIKDNKIIAISDTDDKFLCLVKDNVIKDDKHTTEDYGQYKDNYLLKTEIPAPTVEEQKQMRASAYAKTIDPLHSQKARKTILGTWTEKDEAEYVIKVETLSEEIKKQFPYFE